MIIERGEGDLLTARVDALVTDQHRGGHGQGPRLAVRGELPAGLQGWRGRLGGLDWAAVKPLIVEALARLPKGRALLFEPV